jgi:hypothetical protein
MTHFLGEEKCVRPELRYYEQAAGKSLCFSIEQGFYPLISVQALVVIKGRRDDWTALVMQRSQDVAAAAGFWQFPPAGGFEILGSEDEDAFVVRRQFDLRQALIREFLEEVYGDDDLTSAADVNPELVGSPGYRLVMDAIEDGQLTIHLLGVVTDLVSLRPEFSFLIVIDDPDLRKREYQTETGNWARWLRRSSEAKRIFEFSIPEVQEHLTSSGPWNPSSAGLFKLFWDALNEPDGWLASRYPSLKSCVQ